jgi:hypothetical protein
LSQGASQDSQLLSFILLERDIETFRVVMSAAGSYYDTHGLAVRVNVDSTGAPHDPDLAVPRSNYTRAVFKCELRDTKYRKIDSATQHRMLAPMVAILAPSQRVQFTGNICDFAQIEQLKQTMSPSLICLPAYKWALFQTLSQAKDVANAAAQHDDVRFVLEMHKNIVDAILDLTWRGDPVYRRHLFNSFPEFAVACSVLELEALVIIACGMVKLGEMD